MKKMFKRYIKDWKINLIYLIISIVITVAIFLLYYYLVGPRSILGACNAMTIADGVLLAFFGFPLLNYFGTFDMLGYGFHCIGTVMFTKREKKYVDLVNYQNVKRTIRDKKPLTFVSTGIIFIIATIVLIILEIMYHINY